MNRRQALALTALSYSRILGANDRLRMGFIGLGNRGDQVHDGFLEFGDAVTTAICDLRDDYLDLAARKSRATPARYKDYRKLLEDRNVDAVAIATPDHWHALMMIDACRAGKDVYVEKPLSLTVAEGRRMVQVAAETKRIVQVGIQRRSSKMLQEAVAYLRGGELGHITVAPDGIRCGCGNRGCLETLATDTALLRLLAEKLGRPVSLDEAVSLLGERAGDFQHEIRTVTEYLAIAIAAVINIFNPTTLFVHGTLLVGSDERFARVLERVKQRTLTASLSDCTILATRSSKRQAAIAGIMHHLTNAWAPSLR